MIEEDYIMKVEDNVFEERALSVFKLEDPVVIMKATVSFETSVYIPY